MSFSRDEGLQPTAAGRVGRAEEQIREAEQAADRENFARAAQREQGGGPLRRALRRLTHPRRGEDED